MIDPEVRVRLRAQREAAKLTLKELAKECGSLSQSLACEWEKGTRTPSFAAAMAIERTLGAPRVEEWGYDRVTGFRARPRTAA